MRALIVSFLLVLLSPAMAAHASSIDDCDRLASFDLDHKRRAEPVPRFKIRFDEAIAACETASREHPREGRFLLQLGRAYERKAWETIDQRDYKLAEASYNNAAQLNYVSAFYSLASLYENGDFAFASPKRAFEKYSEGWRLGDPSSTAGLAHIYAFFSYQAQDCVQAWNRLQAAARAPTRIVYSILGVLHRDGVCASELPEAKYDLQLAMTYFRKSAELGHAPSASNLAVLLLETQREAATAEAMRLFLTSVELGHGLAARNIGDMYKVGFGVKQSDAEAVKWYRRGTALRDTSAMRELAIMLRAGRLGTSENAPNFTEADAWDQRARELSKRQADNGEHFAMHQLAIMLWEGIGGTKDPDGAFRYAEMAAERGVVNAINYLGFLYDQVGDAEESFKQYQRAAKRGLPIARANLGYAYCFARGIAKDCTKGSSLLETASKDEAWAALRLAEIHLQNKSYEAARLYFDRAVGMRNTEAMSRLAELLVLNQERRRSEQWPHFQDSRDVAASLIARAASLGDITARRKFAETNLKIVSQRRTSDQCSQVYSTSVSDLQASANMGDIEAHTILITLPRETQCPVAPDVQFRRVTAAATAGEPTAALRLVSMCLQKSLVGCDVPGAIQAIMRAAQSGHPGGALALAGMLESGQHLKKDTVESERLLSTVENSIYLNWRLNLALAWIKGSHGLKAQPERGTSLLRKLATTSYPDAMDQLGRHLLELSTDASLTEAVAVLEKIAQKGANGLQARTLLSNWFFDHWKDLSPNSRRLFEVWARDEPSNGDRLRGLGRIYLEYGDNERFKVEGLNMLMRAVDEHKDSDAMLLAGFAFEYGNGTEANPQRAQALYERSAALKNGNGMAMASMFCFPEPIQNRMCRASPSDYAAMVKELAGNGDIQTSTYIVFSKWMLVPTLHASESEIAEMLVALVAIATQEQLAKLGLTDQADRPQQPSTAMIRAMQRRFRDADLYTGGDDGRLQTLVRGLRTTRSKQ